MDRLEAAAQKEAARAWGAGAREVAVDDITPHGFRWLTGVRVWLAIDGQRRKRLVATPEQGAAVALPHDGDLAPVNRLLAAADVRLPAGAQPAEVAAGLRMLLRGPGGFVGTPTFLAQQRPSLSMWTAPTPDQGPALFEQHCQEPTLRTQDDNWTLTFSYFNPSGGVEAWTITGDPRRLLRAESTPALPDGTFFFPYFG